MPPESNPAVTNPGDVVNFWREAGPNRWFTKNDAFDDEFRQRFLLAHEEAAAGRLDAWLSEADGALGLVILLDQFPRNCFRASPRMYATDSLARSYAERAIAAGFDDQVDRALRLFFYLPFEHSESLADQDRSLALHERIGFAEYAKHHRDIIQRFGRFPHRNAILGRESTPEEQAFLSAGGFAG
jgi:uncharacterized protein (DUF924 family)